MHLKINSPFLTRFAFSPKEFGTRGAQKLLQVNSQWRYIFEDNPTIFLSDSFLFGTVIGTRRDRSLPLICVKLDHRDFVNWIPVSMLRYFHINGKTWAMSEHNTMIRGNITEYRVRAISRPVPISPLTETIRSDAEMWRRDYASNRSILSLEDAAAYVLPITENCP